MVTERSIRLALIYWSFFDQRSLSPGNSFTRPLPLGLVSSLSGLPYSFANASNRSKETVVSIHCFPPNCSTRRRVR
jgi:hypothetical protein